MAFSLLDVNFFEDIHSKSFYALLPLLPMSMPPPPTAIIGAGAAGLYAAYLLRQQGIDCRIFEAADRYGGRLGKLEGFADYPLDLGAEWLHGKKSLLKPFIKQSGTKISKDRSEEWWWFEGKFTEELPRDLEDALEEQPDAPDRSYLDHATQQGFGPEYRYLVEMLAGDLGADATNLSVKWNAVEFENWRSGNKDYKFRRTYYDLIDTCIAAQVRDVIQLNTPIVRIEYAGDQVQLTDHAGQVHQAEQVIITVPITVLQAGDIAFVPPLPTAQTEAFQRIGMDPALKVFLKFSERFYHENIAGGRVCAAYADERIGKKGQDHVLMAFLMGHQAEALAALGSEQAMAEALLAELDGMYEGRASATFLAAHVIDWTAHPYIRGGYSYSKVGIGDARQVAAQPVANRLFFAGEAMNTHGHHQTVHGAMESAERVVGAVLESRRI